jgi:hypothetical protein
VANNWAKWDEERRAQPHLGGRWTSKEGLGTLEKQGVRLTPGHTDPSSPSDITHVTRDSQNLGRVYRHPAGMNWPAYFSVSADKRSIDERGPYQHFEPVEVNADEHGNYKTHDEAVGALLRHHGVPVPKQRSADRVAATVVTGPQSRAVVAGPHTGKRAAPQRGMSDTARNADSVATRIRMNAARTDPITGKKITASTKSSATRVADTIRRPMSIDRVKKIYGKMLTVHRTPSGQPGMIDRHMSALALSPQHHHEIVRQHMEGAYSSGGIHVGNKDAVDMVGTQPYYEHKAGRVISPDRPNEQIGGIYYGVHRQLTLPDDRHSGSVATGSHEFGHALDHAYGGRLSGRPETWASSLPHFQQVFREVTHMHDDSSTQLNPYYTGGSRGTAESGAKEMWAEGYAAWLHGQQRYKTEDERALLIGHEIGASPSEKLRVGRVLLNYFNIQDEKMKEMTA